MNRILSFSRIALFASAIIMVQNGQAQTSLDEQINDLGLVIQSPDVGNIANTQNGTEQSVTNTGAQPASFVGNEIRVLLRPRRTTVVSAEATGQIRSFPHDIGDQFAKGEVLLKIKCSKKFADIAVSKAQLNQSKIEYESNRSLLAQGGVSKFDVELSRARVEEAEASLNSHQVSASYCTLKAPHGGKVVSILASRFEYVNAGVPVMEIIDDSKLNMQLYVPSIWITKLKQKTEFKVFVDEVNKEYDAQVLRINPRVDAGSKTLEVIAGLTENHSELRAGMSGNAKFDFD